MLSRKPLFGVRGVFSLCIVAAIAGWGVSSASAAPVPLPAGAKLSTLIGLNASGGVQIGNFIFSDFSFTGSSGLASNPAPTADSITVTQAPGQNVGLTFNSFWQAVPGGNQDGIIRYSVTVTAGNVIDQVNLGFNGAAPVPSPGTNASVTESVAPFVAGTPGNVIGQLTVTNNIATGNTTTNNSSLTLSQPLVSIFVSKDVQVNSGGGVATVSFVDNTYHSTAGGPIPEPATMGILGVMGAALLARRRRA